MYIAEHANTLREWFTFPDQRADLLYSLCSKKDMHYLAKRFNIPTAETAFPRCLDDVLNFLHTAPFPIILKQIISWPPMSCEGLLVHNERELVDTYEALKASEKQNLLLQEYIPGGDDSQWLFTGYFDERSNCLAGFTGRRIRQWPIHAGVTTLGVCQRNETIAGPAKNLLHAIGYKGIVAIDYRFDARDGQYKVLDINPRIGANTRLFVADNGIDVARALYFDMTGRPATTQAAAPEGRKWVVEDNDLKSSLLRLFDRRFTATQWINSYRGVREAAYFSLDDPGPFLQMLTHNLVESLTPRRMRQLPQRLARSRNLAQIP